MCMSGVTPVDSPLPMQSESSWWSAQSVDALLPINMYGSVSARPDVTVVDRKKQ